MTTQMLIHDLKSPIAALDTLLYSLSDRLLEGEVDLANMAMTRIKDKFKLLRQGKNEKKESCNLVRLTQEVINEKNILYYQNNIKVVYQQSDTILQDFNLESLQYKRIISNMIENGKEAMQKGGSIIIHLSIVHSFLQIKIKDNGVGINHNTLKIIQKLGGTFNKPEGSGHGLDHAKKYLSYWGGFFEIDSIEGIGTIVTLKIPMNSSSIKQAS